jgi:pyruvate,water dikinase
MLRAYTSLAAEQSPEEAAARQKRAREDATRALRAHLGPIRRLRLVMLLRAAHRFIALREELKGCTVRMTTHLRGIGLEGGRRLQAAGVLGSAGDAAFLTLGELVRTVETADAEDIRRRVARRRREYERNLSIELPETFTGRPEPARVGSAEPGDELRGIPVSPGRITGRARVVLDPSGVRIEAGEILVAPITDTGWTPLFAFAAGLVVDLGGQLSHGSIVAREFGLPAVVNVKSGTKDIATGDRITVDGDEGLVIVHREEAAT